MSSALGIYEDDVFKMACEQFRVIADEINESMEGELADTDFRRVPLLYTLFCVIGHRVFGLRDAPSTSPKKALTASEKMSLRDAVISLSDVVVAARNDEPVPETYTPFVGACLRQTDNIKPREERFRTLYRRAFR